MIRWPASPRPTARCRPGSGAVELMEGWSGAALPMPVQIGDVAGGTVATQGVLAALVARSRTGVGSHVQVSLAGALRQWMAVTDRMGTLRSPATLVLTGSDGDRFLVQTPMRFAAKLLELLELDPSTPRARLPARRRVPRQASRLRRLARTAVGRRDPGRSGAARSTTMCRRRPGPSTASRSGRRSAARARRQQW